ncbi:copper transporter complex subunit Ctr4 [Rhodotorula kratochvilovae]
MDHSGMDMGMDMGGGSSGASCQISMLWNWTVMDACFLSKSWHIRSVGDYVGTLIGVFFLVVALEGVRRLGREYDRSIRAAYYRREALALAALAKNQGKEVAQAAPFRPSHKEHAVRSVFYFVQFTVAYLLMLLAMYYNGGMLFAIFSGAGVGHFIFGRDTATDASTAYEASKDECCC